MEGPWLARGLYYKGLSLCRCGFATLLDPRQNIVALEDLNLSFSNINYIKELPFTELKE